MLFLRAIPFSFAILWRYALVLPILLIALTLFIIIAVLATVVVALISPFFGSLTALAFGIAASVIPIMVGMRVGLQAKKIKPRNSYLGVMVAGIGYGLFEGLCILIVLVLCMGAYLLLTPLNVIDFINFQAGSEEEFIAALFDTSAVLTVVLVLVGGTMVIALRTALLVPFAGAAIGADPDGKSHTPFMGFGDGFWSNFALVNVSYIGSAFAIPLVIVIGAALGLTEGLEFAMLQIETGAYKSWRDFSGIGPNVAILAGMALFLYLFFFSLQCAGAVLIFAEARGYVKARHKSYDAEAIAEEQAAQAAPMQNTDLQELLRSRMPQKRY